MDPDSDGYHLKALVMNALLAVAPHLLRTEYVKILQVPTVRATSGEVAFTFHTDRELSEWMRVNAAHRSFHVSRVTSLSSCSREEARKLIAALEHNTIAVRRQGDDDDERALSVAFKQTEAERRRDWVIKECAVGRADDIDGSQSTEISITRFVETQLSQYWVGVVRRSMPSVVDGLTWVQRRLLHSMFTRPTNEPVNVLWLATQLWTNSEYCNNPLSAVPTIINMARGPKNIPLFFPARGEFGSATATGAHYLWVALSPLTRLIFLGEDDGLLERRIGDNGAPLEPVHFLPVIPPVLFNGNSCLAAGIASRIPSFNPRDVINNAKLLLAGKEPQCIEPDPAEITRTRTMWLLDADNRPHEFSSPDEILAEFLNAAKRSLQRVVGKRVASLEDCNVMLLERLNKLQAALEKRGSMDSDDAVPITTPPPVSMDSDDAVPFATPPPSPPTAPVVGLANLGNTCYANSTLQALAATVDFFREILALPPDPRMHAVRALATAMTSCSSVVRPDKFLNAFRPPGFIQGRQHDASEFLGFVLEALHVQESNSQRRRTTIIERMFVGTISTIYRCLSCGWQRAESNAFRDLMLTLPNVNTDAPASSVQDLLNRYCSTEELCGDNQRFCEKCKTRGDAECSTQIVSAPRNFIATLNLHQYDSAQAKKTGSQLYYNDSISINGMRYKLYAAIVHSGPTLDRGHYYSVVEKVGRWYKISDTHIADFRITDLQTLHSDDTPHVLFYRVDERAAESSQERKRIANGAETAPPPPKKLRRNSEEIIGNQSPGSVQWYNPGNGVEIISAGFVCSVCGLVFTTRSRLSAHATSHSAERPHRCTQCGKSYKTKGNLVVHSKNAHSRSTK